MRGVTLASREFLPLATEAAERFTRYTRLPCDIRLITHRGGYLDKFRIGVEIKGPALFFDADLWFRRPVPDPERLFCAGFAGVPDPGAFNGECFVAEDCAKFDLDPARYINTGLFSWHPDYLDVFWAAMLRARTMEDVGDFGEQTFLNAAIQATETPLRLLPHSYNYAPWCAARGYQEPLENPHAVHAMGWEGPRAKARALREATRTSGLATIR